LSVGGLIRETLALVWRNALRIVATAGVLLLPAELATAFAGDESATAGGIAYAVVSLLVYPWAVGAVVAALDEPGAAVLADHKRALAGLPSLFLANLAGGIAVVLAAVLLILPGLLLSARWSATPAMIVVERKPAFDAFGASNALVKGKTWTVLGALLVTALLTLLVALPGAAVSELASSPVIAGIANVALDLPFVAVFAAFAYVVFSQLPREEGTE
jgi:hypothetical protein